MFIVFFSTVFLSPFINLMVEPTVKFTGEVSSELIFVRAFPEPESPCWILGETPATQGFLDHTQYLIGCPKFNIQAIKERKKQGAIPLETIEDWLLMSEPIR